MNIDISKIIHKKEERNPILSQPKHRSVQSLAVDLLMAVSSPATAPLHHTKNQFPFP